MTSWTPCSWPRPRATCFSARTSTIGSPVEICLCGVHGFRLFSRISGRRRRRLAAVSVTIASINAPPAVVRVVKAEVNVVPCRQATFWPGSIIGQTVSADGRGGQRDVGEEQQQLIGSAAKPDEAVMSIKRRGRVVPGIDRKGRRPVPNAARAAASHNRAAPSCLPRRAWSTAKRPEFPERTAGVRPRERRRNGPESGRVVLSGGRLRQDKTQPTQLASHASCFRSVPSAWVRARIRPPRPFA
jgi:hypothetical protein